nr:sigma-70 family RNA polymerase sigma factor [Microbacterium bovistercoris]
MAIETPESRPDDGLSDFIAARGGIFAAAYRLTGRAGDAEDAVQETWLRWQRHDRSGVRNPAAFLATTARHVAINELTSAHARHEVATAEWQDCAAREDDPATHAERTAALDAAAARLAAHLTPAERAAFVLRVGFDYPYARIAALLETSAAGARQLVSRARRDLLCAPARSEPGSVAHRHLLRELIFACRTGDLERLEMLLRRDAGLGTRRRRDPAAGRSVHAG